MQRGPWFHTVGLNTQIVSLHINLTLIGVIDSKEFVISGINRLAGVGMKGTFESHVADRARNIYAIKLGFV